MGEIDYSKFTPAFQEKVEEKPPEVVVETQVATPETITPEPIKPAEVKPETVAPPPEVKQDTLNYEFFNKTFKTDFKTEDDLKKVIELSSKAKEFEDRVKDYEELKQKLEAYQEGVDVLKYFKSEDDYKVQQFAKTNPDKDASVAFKLFTSDMSKLGDLDVLTQFELLDGVISNEAEAKILIAEKYGIDLEADPKEWTALARTQLKRDANKARGEIKLMKEGIPLPEKVDVEGRRKQAQEEAQKKAELLNKGWGDIVPKMLNELKEVEINDYDKDGKAEFVFKYAVPEEDKKQLRDDIMTYLTSNGKEINEDNVKEAGNVLQGMYVLRNVGKMMKAIKAEIAAAIDEQKDKETHNPNPIKTEVKPPDDEAVAKKKAETAYALGGSTFKPNKPSWLGG